MRYHIFSFVPCALCCLVFAFSACRHDEVVLSRPNDNFRPAAGYLQNNGEFSLLYAAIQRAGLVDEWNTASTITVFAPNNQAFNEWGILQPKDFERFSPDSLRFILQYHTLARRLNASDIPAPSVDNAYETQTGDSLLIARSGSGWGYWYINGANVTRSDITLGNGVMHSINKVLKYDRATLQHLLETQTDLRIFTAALKRFGYWDQLAEVGPWTIVAPTDTAFKKASLSLETIQSMDTSQFSKRLFSAYIFRNQFFRQDLSILTKTGAGGYYSQDSAPIRLPIPGDEGYCHGISSTLLEFFVALASTEDGGAPQPIHIVHMNLEAHDDYLTKNGILHKIDDLAFLPDETLIR